MRLRHLHFEPRLALRARSLVVPAVALVLVAVVGVQQAVSSGRAVTAGTGGGLTAMEASSAHPEPPDPAPSTSLPRAALHGTPTHTVAGVDHPAFVAPPAAPTTTPSTAGPAVSLPPITLPPITLPLGPTTTTVPPPPPVPPTAVEPTHPTPAEAQLASRLNALLYNTNSCLEVRDAAGNVVYAHDASSALAPASTQKLLVAAAALAVLGPDYHFVTKVEAAHAPVNGEVDDLWLVGGGDPVLSSPAYTGYLAEGIEAGGLPVVTTQLNQLIPQLQAAGVRSVPNGVHGDDSRYDRTRSLPTWSPVYLSEGDVAPLSALEVDDGLDNWHPLVETSDPTGHAAGVLAALANSSGIATKQGTDGTAPAGAVVLASITSPPLSDIVTEMLRNSDNTAAELLTRELDRATGGTGTTPGGVAVVMKEAAALGLPTAGLSLVDGSGLSPEARVTCDTLYAALNLSSQPNLAALGRLSVSGEYGTLVNRFLGTPAQGHLAGKTGSIDGVIGLVAHMNIGADLSFSFLLNGPFGYNAGSAYEDRLVAALTTYP